MKSFCFVVVVNKKYLSGFHVLVHTLRRQGVLNFADIAVVTTEASLQRDPVVNNFAKIFKLVSDEEIERFRVIPPNGVKEHLRLENIAKYNFLKFYCFKDLGYEYNILIDCDIMCMNGFQPSELEGDFEIAVTPRFSPKMYPDDIANELSQDAASESIELLFKNYDTLVNSYGINSGVLVVSRKMMRDEVVSEMIELAAEMEAGGDQSVIWKYIKKNKVNFKTLHPKFNFNQHALSHVQASKQVQWMAQSVLLHYPGSYPWEADQTMKKVSHAVWHQANKEARRWIKTIEEES